MAKHSCLSLTDFIPAAKLRTPLRVLSTGASRLLQPETPVDHRAVGVILAFASFVRYDNCSTGPLTALRCPYYSQHVFSHSRSIASLGSSLIFGLFLMFLARLAYLPSKNART